MTDETNPTPASRMGRPTSMTPEVIGRILDLLVEGRSVRDICDAEDMPDRGAVMRHRWRDPVFNEQYLAAKAAGTEPMIEDQRHRVMTAPPEAANLVRVQSDWVKFEAGRLAPRRWGDDNKIKAELSGPDGKPIQLQAAPAPLVPSEVRAGIKALLTKAEQDMGLPPGADKPDEERLKAIMQSGEVLSPDLYEAVFEGKE